MHRGRRTLQEQAGTNSSPGDADSYNAGVVDDASDALPAGLPIPPGLSQQLDAVQPRPGVYLLKDRHGKVIYVGKAKNLRARVRTYFRGGDERSQVRFLMQRVAGLETLVTVNDKEALILENNLIKQYKPRYNIRLKDDKSYVSVKVTAQDPWPRILVTRKIVKDGSKYFGPYASAWAVRETLDTIRKVIPLRTCSDGVFRNRSRPCIEFQIKRCLGPCCLPVDPAVYQRHVREATLLLEGKSQQLTRQLAEEMRRACGTESAPSNGRRSGSRSCRTGEMIRTSSASTVRAASSRCRSCSSAKAS